MNLKPRLVVPRDHEPTRAEMEMARIDPRDIVGVEEPQASIRAARRRAPPLSECPYGSKTIPGIVQLIVEVHGGIAKGLL